MRLKDFPTVRGKGDNYHEALGRIMIDCTRHLLHNHDLNVAFEPCHHPPGGEPGSRKGAEVKWETEEPWRDRLPKDKREEADFWFPPNKV
jgi:hypothetical protein